MNLISHSNATFSLFHIYIGRVSLFLYVPGLKKDPTHPCKDLSDLFNGVQHKFKGFACDIADKLPDFALIAVL